MITKPTARINRTAATLNKYRPQPLASPPQQGGFSGTPGSLQKPILGGGGTKPITTSPSNSPFQQGPQLGGNRQVQSSFARPNEYRLGAGGGGFQASRRPATAIAGNAPAAPSIASPPRLNPNVAGSSPKPAWSAGVNPALTQQAPPAQAPSPGSWASGGFATSAGALQNGLHRIDPGNFASMMTDAQGTASTIRGLGAYDPGTAPAEEPLDPFGSSGAGLSSAPQPEQGAQEELYGTSSQGLTSSGEMDENEIRALVDSSSNAKMPDGSPRAGDDYVDRDGDGVIDTYLYRGWQPTPLSGAPPHPPPSSGVDAAGDSEWLQGRGYSKDDADFAVWAQQHSGGDIYVDEWGTIRSHSGKLGGSDGTHGGKLGDDPVNWDPKLRAMMQGFNEDPARVAAARSKEADEHNRRVQEALGMVPDAPEMDTAALEAQIKADEQLRAMASARALNAAIGDNRGRLGVGATAGLTAGTTAQAGAEHAHAAAGMRSQAAQQNFQAQLQQYDAQISMLQGVIAQEQNEQAQQFQRRLMFEIENRRAAAQEKMMEAQAAQQREDNLFDLAGQWLEGAAQSAGSF